MTIRETTLRTQNAPELATTTRYYFHLVSDTAMAIDHIGEEHADLAAAEARARELAQKHASSEQENVSVVVIDGSNTEVLRVGPSAAETLIGFVSPRRPPDT